MFVTLCVRVCVVVSDELITEAVALSEADTPQDADQSSADSKDKERRSVSPCTQNVHTYGRSSTMATTTTTTAVSFDAQPVNFYLRIGAIGSFINLSYRNLTR